MSCRAFLIAGLACLVFAGGAAPGASPGTASAAGGKHAGATTAATIGGPFELVDHTGRTVTERTFRGRFMLIFFGYTYCPDICPTNLQIISDAMDRLGAAGSSVQPIFISVDPARDTVETMADYVGNFHPRLLGLTGTRQQVRAAARAYRAHYFKFYPMPAKHEPGKTDGAGAGDGDVYFMAHPTATFLMGPEGEFLRKFVHETSPEAMAAGIRAYLKDAP